ncbi:MAG: hypothetical protein IPM29_13795 [Planctomycetes bacterium]|nr:hypothetical protein [Planctomycetota bacterium]
MTPPDDAPPRPAAERCPACGVTLQLVRVHGHGQCAHCGTNVEPCCAGAGDEVDARESGHDRATVATLCALVAGHGGAVQRDVLLNDFSDHTGAGWGLGARLLREAIAGGDLRLDARSGLVESGA